MVHSSRYLLSLGMKGKARKTAYCLDSDYLRQLRWRRRGAKKNCWPRLGYKLKPFGTNSEESYGAGEGAVVFDRLNPELTEKLCGRIHSLADDTSAIHVVASSYTKAVLRKHHPDFNVITIEGGPRFKPAGK